MKTSEHPFIQQLRKDQSLVTKVEKVAEGDWDHLLQVARQEGHKLDKEALIRLFPSGFYKGSGKYPDRGWKPDHQTLPKQTRIPLVVTWRLWPGCALGESDMQSQLRASLIKEIKALGWALEHLNIQPKWVQLHLEYPLHTNLGKALEELRAKTSLDLKQAFPKLFDQQGHVPLWAPEVGIHPTADKSAAHAGSAATKPLHP